MTITQPVPVDPSLPLPRTVVTRRGVGDRIFSAGTMGAGLAVLSIMVLVGTFLTAQAFTALRRTGIHFLTTAAWQPDRNVFGIASVLSFTVTIAVIAVCVSLPVSMGAALFITEIAPGRLRSWCVALVDLMAAIPSVIYGLWGLFLLQGKTIGISRWLSSWFAWIPVLKVTGSDSSNPLTNNTVFTASSFIAGLVVAMMVIPIQCSVMREVFSQVPSGEREGALALGSTRYGMIRMVTLPFGRGGIIGGTMLGLGRALGETIAVVIIVSPRFDFTWHVLEAGSNSVSSLIALRYSEASGFGLSALMAAGLALFVLTLVVNFTASVFVSRSRSGASSEA